MTQTPDLRIETKAGGRKLLLASASGKREKFRLKDSSVIRHENVKLVDYLTTFRAGFADDVEADPSTAAKQLDGIRAAGAGYLSKVIDESYSRFDLMCKFIREACDTWNLGLSRPPFVHIVSDLEQHVPWEAMPIFDTRTKLSATTKLELQDEVRCFMGFGAVVERKIPHSEEHGDILDATGYLQVRFFIDASFDGADAELGFFDSCGERVRVEGPYPSGDEDDHTPTVGQQLRDPTIGVHGDPLERPDQVVHFSCHCDTDGRSSWHDYELRLAAETGQSKNLSLWDLHVEIGQATPWRHPDGDRLMPLVFVNACGSTTMDPHSAASILTPFAKNQNRGLVGTMARIPDGFASQFSKVFYRELFSGLTIGMALHKARWRMLQDSDNPMGLLYAHFGDAGLRVAPVITPVHP